MANHASPDDDALRAALARQHDPDAHDRSLILERLAWTPEQRLRANAAFLRFYLPPGRPVRLFATSSATCPHSRRKSCSPASIAMA